MGTVIIIACIFIIIALANSLLKSAEETLKKTKSYKNGELLRECWRASRKLRK